MTNSSNEDKKSYVCGVEGGVVGWGDVGVGIACSLCNFYDTRESNFHQFHAGGFKHEIGNFAIKRR